MAEVDGYLFSYVFRKIRLGLGAVLAVSFFINLLMLATPLYMLQIYDRILTSKSVDSLLLLTLIVVAALATIAVLEGVRSAVMSRISQWISRALSGETLKLSIKRTLRQEQPASVQSLRDLDAVRGFLTSSAIYPLVDAPWASIYLVAIFLLHPLLGWIAFLGALLLLIIALVNDLLTRQRQQISSDCGMTALRHAEATVRNADVVSAMGMAPQLTAHWDRVHNLALEQLEQANARGGLLVAVSKFIRLCLQVAILGCGAYLAIDGVISAGAIVAGSILVGRALAPVDQAIVTWRSALAALSAYRRLQAHFAGARPDSEKMALPKPSGALSAEAISFAYPGQSEAALKGIQFALAPGESMALIGPSGSGKTTLVRVLLGNLVPQTGHARLDGLDIGQWHEQGRGRYIGYLPQDVELFSGTVRENIARMSVGEPARVVKAAMLADVHHLIMGLPKGYNTSIGANGMALSGGQRQRIGLARALYGDPRLVVLDEPNANLDRAGERALTRALALLKKRKVTTIIISHRPELFTLVDRVMVLNQGMIQAFGSSDQVLAKKTTTTNLAAIRPMTTPKITFSVGQRDGH